MKILVAKVEYMQTTHASTTATVSASLHLTEQQCLNEYTKR